MVGGEGVLREETENITDNTQIKSASTSTRVITYFIV